MEEHKCPFSAPLISQQFDCVHAQEVIHRGGAEIACTDAQAHARCEPLFLHMKAAALPAFGVEDDLLSMPHSVQVKIQYGGLLGLQRLLPGAAVVPERVGNIDALVVNALTRFGSLDAVPCEQIVVDITAFKPRSRRGC
jgi:hypothetical protein